MLKWKSQLTCSYCSKIFKDPIVLPCDDSICGEHLFERDVIKENRIKCNVCNQEFQVKDNQFKSSKAYQKLVERQSYLSDEEQGLKKDLEESTLKLFEFYEEFIKSRTKLESNVFEHFQEFRFQIDEHREELKKKIDEIALQMIDETKKYEAMYLNNLKKNFFKTPHFDQTQTLENELNQIEVTFRNPNLLIEAIKEMQLKQEESLNEIQYKLNEFNQVKDDLKSSNEFKPNLSWFDQEEQTSLFVSIRLNSYCPNMNLFKSEILNGERQCTELIELCEFSPNDKWSLLYRATRDGFGAKDFHLKCDGHSNTLTLLKAKETEFIFGGFTSVEWDSSSYYKPDRNAFIFSLTNKDNKPLKMKFNPNEHHHAIFCHSEFGLTFGYGSDIIIENNANTTMKSHSDLGKSYPHPQYAYGTNEAATFLAGSFEFQLDEIEVYQKE